MIHVANLIERRVNNDAAFRLLIEKLERGLKHASTSAVPTDPQDSVQLLAQVGG
jgi:hypothetical protein